MRILFCIDSLEKGGAERVICNLANEFTKNNLIGIVTTVNKIEYDLDNNIMLYNLENRNGKKTTNKIQRLTKLFKVIKEFEPNIIISFLPEPSFMVLLLRKIVKTPIIVSVRNDPRTEYKTLKRNVLMKLLYPLADGFVFQTDEAREFFSKKIRNKSTIIPNPIKKEFLERKPYFGEKENIIVSVGRLEEQKNHALLIDSFYEINKEIKDYKLIIYGEGSLRQKLEQKIKEYNMQERIFLPGIVENIPDKIEKAKLFVLTSDFEGMPNALMEAMALGLVCISTDCPCGGPRFLIKDNENGFLVKVKDKEDLIEKIKNVLLKTENDKLDYISQKAREKTQELTTEKIVLLWDKYISNIINKKLKEGKNGQGVQKTVND